MSTHIRKIKYTYKGKTEDMWLVVWKDLKGDPREKRFRNKRHAEEHRILIDRELSDNIHVADRATVTIGKMGEAWLKDCERRWNTIDRKTKKRLLSGNTYHSYLTTWKNHVKPRFAHMKLNNRNLRRDIQAFVNELGTKYDVGGTPKQVKAVTFNIFEYAVVELEVIPRNPLRDKKIKLPGEPHSRGGDDIPTPDEALKLITRLHEPKPPGEKKLDWAQKLALITLAMFAGLRLRCPRIIASRFCQTRNQREAIAIEVRRDQTA